MADYDHFAYMEDIAARLRAIGHSNTTRRFFRSSTPEDLEEMFASLSSVPSDAPVLVAIDDLDETFSEPDTDDILSAPEYGFIVLHHVEQGNDADLFAKRKLCRSVAHKIVARMLRDSTLRTHPFHGSLNRSSVIITAHGPVGDNFHGTLVWFSLQTPFEWIENVNDWK